MIVAIDPDTKRHACAMGEIINGYPHCKRVWTIQREVKKDHISPHYREGICDLILLAEFHGAPIVCEDAYLGTNPLTFRRLIEARCEITVPAMMDCIPWSLVSPSTWQHGIGVKAKTRAEIEVEYMAFARNWAKSTKQFVPETEHECAAMCILWWALTTEKGKKNGSSGLHSKPRTR